MKYPKQTRHVDEDFLALVRTQPCAVSDPSCRGQIVPHHVKTRGSGGSDLTAVPLCVKHHDEGGWSWVKFNKKYPGKIAESKAEIMRAWAEKKHEEMKDGFIKKS